MDGQALDPKHNSRQLTEGPERAPARAYLHGIGFDAEALAKPIIGVASTWTETMPCNFGLRDARREGQGGHPRRRRHADGVQHDRDLRRDHDGHAGHEDVAGQPRGRRRLDRARRPRAHVRRDRRARRLRQDDPGRGDGAGAAQRPRRAAVRRLDPARPLQGRRRLDPRGLRGASARTPRARSATRSCASSRRPPRRASAPAAGSSRPTRWRWRSRCSGCRRWAPRWSRPPTRTRTASRPRPAS